MKALQRNLVRQDSAHRELKRESERHTGTGRMPSHNGRCPMQSVLRFVSRLTSWPHLRGSGALLLLSLLLMLETIVVVLVQVPEV